MKDYIICTTARSGSNLLCDVLKNTGLLGAPTEAFNPDFIRTGGYKAHTENGVGVSASSFIRWLRKEHVTPNGVFGTKILFEDYNVFRHFPEFLELISNCRLIHLRRRSKLRQAISYFFAEETGQWVFSDRPKKQISDVQFDYDRIKRHLDRLMMQDSSWISVFSALERNYIEIYFEDFVSDMEQHVRSILEQLNLEAADLKIRVSIEEQKNARTSEFFQRFVSEFRAREFAPAARETYKGLDLVP